MTAAAHFTVHFALEHMLPKKIFSHSERLLVRTAISSFGSRLRSKIARATKREKSPKPDNAKPSGAASLPWIYLLQPSITEREIASVMEALAGEWNGSDHIRRFEREFREYVAAPHALATSSCTGALHLALRAMGVGQGDEVIVPDLTWVATANAVVQCGAKPVFVDIDPVSWCIDPYSTERAITSKTKVILPVHQYGRPADMPALLALAKRHNLRILEDAAGAMGTSINGKRIGGWGDATAFSFHSTKLMTTSEGGMLTVNDPALFNRIDTIARRGLDPADPTRAVEIGMNYRMSHLHAAVGLAQLKRIDQLLAEKRRTYEWYRKHLHDIPGVKLREEPFDAHVRSNCWLCSIELDEGSGLAPKDVIARMREKQISVQPVATPLSSMPVYQSGPVENPIAHRALNRGLLIPSGLNLRESEVIRICSSLREVCSMRKM